MFSRFYKQPVAIHKSSIKYKVSRQITAATKIEVETFRFIDLSVSAQHWKLKDKDEHRTSHTQNTQSRATHSTQHTRTAHCRARRAKLEEALHTWMLILFAFAFAFCSLLSHQNPLLNPIDNSHAHALPSLRPWCHWYLMVYFLSSQWALSQHAPPTIHF